MEIQKATRSYEKWLTNYTSLVQADLDFKHQQMALAPFPFLRATFYRWAQTWLTGCEEAAKAPTLLAVGDLHVENFGTWRDAEGRLVWGINDFDEACYLPYINDLVRLATSALLAMEANHLQLTPTAACDSILTGYTDGLKSGGRPFTLAEDHAWLRTVAFGTLRDPTHYWQKMQALPLVKTGVPESAQVALEQALPHAGLTYQVKSRIAGLGSLGHPRYVALAEWEGGLTAREAKALVPSSVVWAKTGDGAVEIYYQAIVDRAVRCRDPFVRLNGHWIMRRLAPDCSRIELSALAEESAEAQLLNAMGFETANVHLGSHAAIKAVQQDLKQRKKGWLLRAADSMTKATLADWQRWKSNPA